MCGCSRETARERADGSGPLTNSAAIDLNASIAKAGAEKKIVLLDFTGSDWCGPCMQLHSEIFEQPDFKSYAESNLVFLVVDFPTKYRLPADASATNEWLAEKFGVDGFPTLIALDGRGKKLWQQVGFSGGNSKEWIATLDSVRAKAN